MQRRHPEKHIDSEMGKVVLSEKEGLRHKKIKHITFMVILVHPHIKTASRNNSKIPLPAAYEC